MAIDEGTHRRGNHGARPSLFWRLLPSYLLVVAIGALTTFFVGESFAPFFLDRHVSSMMDALNAPLPAPMGEGMLADLEGAYLRALTSSLSWAAGVSAVAAALVGLFMTRRIVRPLRAMTHVSARIAGGTYHDRLDDGAPGEVGDLAVAFNTMAATLERSEEQRAALLADVSHEFRTPLSNLKGYLEGLEDGVFEFDERTAVSCRRQVERLERLIDDLSLLSRVETGQVHLRPRTVELAQPFHDARDALRARFERKGVHLIVEEPRGEPVVFADPERLGQVLANLLVNALRYTAPGGHVTLRARRADDDEVKVEVEDDGAGIEPDALQHVFKRFYRDAGARRSDGESGSGIGLTLVQQLVERQGGRVGVDSVVGSGSRFWFTLPATARAAAAEQREA